MSERSRNRLNLTADAETAIKQFRDSKPWRGSHTERFQKFQALHKGLCRAFGISPALKYFGPEDSSCEHGTGGFAQTHNAIILVGKLSVVTYLFAFVCATGNGQPVSRAASLTWARNVFRYYFPRSFAGCRMQGACLVRDMGLRN